MKQPTNGYVTFFKHLNTSGADEDFKRYEHIVFDEQLMTAINDGLSFIDNKFRKRSLAPILSLLLN